MRFRRTLSLLPLTVLAILITSLAHADFQAGKDAYDKGDYATALKEWQPLAEQGDAEAQHNLGGLYALGQGVPQDYAQAASWWVKAAEQGYANKAQSDLGLLYDKGQGVPQDYTQARDWYRKAAEQGFPPAQHNLGVLYANGQGVPQDYVQASMWYKLAAAQGQVKAAIARGQITKKMTYEQIAEAQRLVREWLAQHQK